LAGMLWSKQYYYFDGYLWLQGHEANPLRAASRVRRNRDWFHMINDDVLSMPDKWEYPWYAAWDLAFHTIALSGVDLEFAKGQLGITLSGRYMHPNGQVPAYEWNFSDVNPPVHAWATLFLHRTEQALRGKGDLDFLKSAFSKLMVNFTWWVNRKDRFGKNVFDGGFLGLDNISVFDRSAALPTGGNLEQADGTAWMCLFCQNMAELATELASHDRAYDDFVAKCVDHFLWIAKAMEPAESGRNVGRRRWLLLRFVASAGWQVHTTEGALDGGSPAVMCDHGRRAVAARAHALGSLLCGSPETNAGPSGFDPSHRARSFWVGRARHHRFA
jgi:hypothetical protein